MNNQLISHLCTFIQIFFQPDSFLFKPLSNKIFTPKTKRLVYFQHIRPTQHLKSDTSESIKLAGILVFGELNWNNEVEKVLQKLKTKEDYFLKAYLRPLFHRHINYEIIWGHVSNCNSVSLMWRIAGWILASSE